MQVYEHFSELESKVGQELGVSDWVLIDQARISQFADATGDHQWIHMDPVKAAEGPFGTTIAHGFLTLSLIPLLGATAYEVRGGRMGINYGLEKVRFPAPVPVDSRVRGRFVLHEYRALPDEGVQITVEVTMEREGGDKPVCVAQSVMRRY